MPPKYPAIKHNWDSLKKVSAIKLIIQERIKSLHSFSGESQKNKTKEKLLRGENFYSINPEKTPEATLKWKFTAIKTQEMKICNNLQEEQSTRQIMNILWTEWSFKEISFKGRKTIKRNKVSGRIFITLKAIKFNETWDFLFPLVYWMLGERKLVKIELQKIEWVTRKGFPTCNWNKFCSIRFELNFLLLKLLTNIGIGSNFKNFS